MMTVRVCRDCGEEYRLDAPVLVCADCGGTIVARETARPADDGGARDEEEDYKGDGGDDTATDAEGEDPPGPEPPFHLAHFAQTADEIRPFAARLGEAGIPFAVRASANQFELFVQESDTDRADEALSSLLAAVPSTATFDPEVGYDRCPACEATLAPGAESCPDCGLSIGESDPEPQA